MDYANTLDQIRSWIVEDRIRLVQAVWDSIPEDVMEPELNQAQKDELDRRMADLDEYPERVLTWDQIESHVRQKNCYAS